MSLVSSERTSLPGTLWGIATYFNPAGYKNKRRNFQVFRERIKRQGLPLIVIEAAIDSAAFELTADDAECVIHVHSTAALWQKERLFNVALTHLPDDCDKVVWLDTDVLFDNDCWIQELSIQLEFCHVVQPFMNAVQLPRGTEEMLPSEQCVGEQEPQPGVIAWWLADKRTDGTLVGHSGYAVAARRSLLDRFGFYDRGIVGSGDSVMIGAFLGIDPHSNAYLRLDHCPLLDHAAKWSAQVSAIVDGNVGTVSGTVFHLWHGSRHNRFYVERGALLHDFDPENDIVINEQGCWAWATDKPTLHARVRAYFWMREEEAENLSLMTLRACALQEQVDFQRNTAEMLRAQLKHEQEENALLRRIVAASPGPILRRFCVLLDRLSTLLLPRHSRFRRIVRSWFLRSHSG